MNCILTTYNFQIGPRLIKAQARAIDTVLNGLDIQFIPLRYNLPHKFISHHQVLDFGVRELFKQYDNILILDVDAIPLSIDAVDYTFNQIKQNKLVGCAQRSMHIDNNKHVYVGSPVIGFSKELFNAMGKPSFIPTNRGDTAEELTYICEEKNLPVEIFRPLEFQKAPVGAPYWELETPDQRYGIGTTFINKNGCHMFYHLFESRVTIHNNLFIEKCREIYEG